MPNYHLIRNLKLRQFLMSSESIQSKSAEEIQKFIEELAILSEEEQKDVMKVFESEQKQIAVAKNKEKALLKVKAIKHNFDHNIRTYREDREIKNSNQIAQNLLNNM